MRGGGGAKRGPWRPLGEGPRMETGDDPPEQEHHYSMDIAWIIHRSSKRLTKLQNKKIYLQCFLINGRPDSNNCRDSGAIVKKEVSTVMGNRATCNLNVIAGKASPT